MPKNKPSSRQICPTCKGKSFTVVQKTRIENGRVVTKQEHEPCSTCAGTGWVSG